MVAAFGTRTPLFHYQQNTTTSNSFFTALPIIIYICKHEYPFIISHILNYCFKKSFITQLRQYNDTLREFLDAYKILTFQCRCKIVFDGNIVFLTLKFGYRSAVTLKLTKYKRGDGIILN